MSDLDFIPSSYHAGVSHRRRKRSQLAWGVAMLLAMGIWHWTQRVSLCEAQERREQSRSQWAELTVSRNYFDALLVERERLARRNEALAALDDPASIVVVLAELGGLQPDGVVLTELQYDTADARRAAALLVPPLLAGGAPAPPGTPPPPVAAPWQPVWPRLRLVGAAVNNVYISAQTAKLGGSPLFRDVNTEFVKDAMIENRRVRQFEVACNVLPQVGGSK